LGKACGDDGCGSTCGTCPTGFDCNSGQCSCNPDCTGRECGDDGCGGKCGTDCSGSQVCVGGKCTDQCIASCSGKTCGDDGCGGSCGSCTSPQSCASSQCAWPSKSFGSDVYPIIKNHGCAGTSCHGGARPAQGLDMSSQSVAYGSLVNVASSECKSRKLVLPGAPASSYMLDKVKGTNLCSGSKMPKTGTGLSSAEINTVASWIGSGAAQ
jgi:hypothetical protein